MTVPLDHLGDFLGFYQIGAACLAMMLAGRVVTGGRWGPAVQLMTGWGILCLLLTLWGIATPLSLRLPAGLFLALAAAGLVRRGAVPLRQDLAGVGRILVLGVPLLWITAGMRPSQPDIFINLLPNAAYLFDHALFPAAGRPDAHSFLPLAPYDTQLVTFLGSLFGGGLVPSGLALFTVLLHFVAGLLLAEILSHGAPPGWSSAAGGLLFATLLNPGFVPRVAFAGYGEAPLAVSLLVATWLAAKAMEELAAASPRPAILWPLALTLAAMINIKQQAVGLVAAFLIGAAAIAGADRRIGWRRGLAAFAIAAVPALLLYGAWRLYALGGPAASELEPLPLARWQWGNIPQVIASMLQVMVEKPIFYGAILASAALLVLRLRGGPLDAAGRALALTVACFLLYDGFLMATYIGHFQGEMSLKAHSYFRYSTHLSLLIVLGLVLALRDAPALRAAFARRQFAVAASAAAIAAVLLAPLGFADRLRFDLEWPQPRVWELAARLAPRLGETDRLALFLPGDNGSLAEMVSGALRYAAPRRPGLEIRIGGAADEAGLGAAARDGYRLALLSCGDGSSLALPPHAAALLAWSESSGWQTAEIWPYTDPPRRARWTRTIAGPPLCLP